MPVKILRIINRFNIGGPTYNVAYLTAYLSENFETKLLGGLPDKGEEDSSYILEKLNIKPERIDMERSIQLKKDLKAYRAIRKIIREYKPDIVHTHASKAGTLGRLAAHKEKVPVIVHTFHGHVFHSYFGTLKTYLFKSIERFLAKKSTAIIAISEEQKRELTEIHKICKPQKTVVVPLGFDLKKFQENKKEKRNAFREKHKLEEGTFAVGIIGRLAPVKNHKLFLEAFTLFSDKIKDTSFKVFIIGDGTERETIEQKIQTLPDSVKNNIILTSWIKEIDTAIAGLDLIVLTSLNEGTPVSLIEAQAGGKAVVSTNVGGVKDIVKNGETGIVLKTFDPKELSEQLLWFCKNPEKSKQMGIDGEKWAQGNFSYHRLTADMEKLYHKLLKEKGIIS